MKRDRFIALPGARIQAGRRGFTLQEIAALVVFSVVALTIIATVALTKIHRAQRIARAVQETVAIVQNMRAANARKDASVGEWAKIYPSDMIRAQGCPTDGGSPCVLSPWNTWVRTGINTGWNGATPDSDKFELTFENVDPGDCPNFMTEMVAAESPNRLVYAASTGTGGFHILPYVPINDLQTVGCYGDVTFQFGL